MSTEGVVILLILALILTVGLRGIRLVRKLRLLVINLTLRPFLGELLWCLVKESLRLVLFWLGLVLLCLRLILRLILLRLVLRLIE